MLPSAIIKTEEYLLTLVCMEQKRSVFLLRKNARASCAPYDVPRVCINNVHRQADVHVETFDIYMQINMLANCLVCCVCVCVCVVLRVCVWIELYLIRTRIGIFSLCGAHPDCADLFGFYFRIFFRFTSWSQWMATHQWHCRRRLRRRFQ